MEVRSNLNMFLCLEMRLSKLLFKHRQWLFRRRRQFALGIYFAVIVHVCLYSRVCYYHTSGTVV